MTLRTTVDPQCDVIHSNFAFGVVVDLHLHRVHFLVVIIMKRINCNVSTMSRHDAWFEHVVIIRVEAQRASFEYTALPARSLCRPMSCWQHSVNAALIRIHSVHTTYICVCYITTMCRHVYHICLY